MTVRTWSGTVALLGVETGDGRILMPDASVSFRSNTGFLGWQKTSGMGGHSGSMAIGGYTDAEVIDGAIVVPPGKGFFLDTPEAAEAQQYIERGVMSPSIDPDTVDVGYFNADTLEELEDDAFFDALFGLSDTRVVEGYKSFVVAGATLVMHSALDGVGLVLDPVDESAEAPSLGLVASVMASAGAADRRKAEVAAGRTPTGTDASGLPIAYSTPFGFEVSDGRFFTAPDLDWPMGVHRVTDGPDRGRVQGYIADRDSYHLSSFLQGREYVRPPVSVTDHFYFRQTAVTIEQTGERVAVGKLCVGGGHVTQSDDMDWLDTQRAYDDTATTWAVVAVGDNEVGTWVSGYVLEGTAPRVLADGLSSAYSGHWCAVPGLSDPELVAAVGVNTPAFAVPRVAMSLGGDTPLVRSMHGFGIPASRHPMAARWRELQSRRPRSSSMSADGSGTTELASAVVDEMERRAAWRDTSALAERLRSDRVAAMTARVTDLRNRKGGS